MTCKECIHYEVCYKRIKFWIEYKFRKKDCLDFLNKDSIREVKHGRDICGYDEDFPHYCEFRCSICGYWLSETCEGHDCDNWFEYCPHCGAKMDGNKNECGQATDWSGNK